jgi:hypothetical protein
MRFRPRPVEDIDPNNPEYRHGLLMREVTDLSTRVEVLERKLFRVSMRPQAKTAGTASVVAGSLVALLELLRYAGLFK